MLSVTMLTAAAVLTAAAPAPAAKPALPPLADAVPADTLLYLGCGGTGGLGAGFAGGALDKAFAQKDLQEVLAALQAHLTGEAAAYFADGAKDQRPAVRSAFEALWPVLRDRPTALALRCAGGEYQLALIADPGPDREAFAKAVAAAEAALAGNVLGSEKLRAGDVEYRRVRDAVDTLDYGFVGGRFFVCRGAGGPAFAAALQEPGGLAATPGFADTLAQVNLPAAAAYLYIDVEAWERVEQAGTKPFRLAVQRFRGDDEAPVEKAIAPPAEAVPEEPEKDEEPKKEAPKDEGFQGLAPGADEEPAAPRPRLNPGPGPRPPVRRRLLNDKFRESFGDIKRLGIGLAFEGGEARLAAWFAGARLSPGAPAVSRELVRSLPADAEYFTAAGIPADRLLRLFVEAGWNWGTPALTAPNWPETFRKAVGADWDKDLVAHLGSGMAYNSPAGGGRWLFGFTAVFDVKDAAAVGRVQKQFVERVRKVQDLKIEHDPRRWSPDNIVRLGETREGPYTVYHLVPHSRWGGDRSSVPAWCLTEDRLIIGLYPQTVKAAVRRIAIDPDSKTLWDRPEFKRLWAKVPKGAVGVSGADTGRVLTGLSGILLWFAAAAEGELRPLREWPVPFGLIPGPDLFTPYLGPSVSWFAATPAGVRYESVGGLPVPPETAMGFAAAFVNNMLPQDGLRRVFGLKGRFEAEAAPAPAEAVPEKAEPAKPEPDEKKPE
jgi:hypothetical protein